MAHGMLTKRKYSLEAQFAQSLNFGNDQALIFFMLVSQAGVGPTPVLKEAAWPVMPISLHTSNRMCEIQIKMTQKWDLMCGPSAPRRLA